jgi:hypothetical protein
MKRYLGDGVYADLEHGRVTLTTEDGIQTTNTIFLEADVYAALCAYVVAERRAPIVSPRPTVPGSDDIG